MHIIYMNLRLQIQWDSVGVPCCRVLFKCSFGLFWAS